MNEFKVGDLVNFKLTNKKAMILGNFEKTDNIFSPPYTGYLIRLDTLEEISVRPFEIEEWNE